MHTYDFQMIEVPREELVKLEELVKARGALQGSRDGEGRRSWRGLKELRDWWLLVRGLVGKGG